VRGDDLTSPGTRVNVPSLSQATNVRIEDPNACSSERHFVLPTIGSAPTQLAMFDMSTTNRDPCCKAAVALSVTSTSPYIAAIMLRPVAEGVAGDVLVEVNVCVTVVTVGVGLPGLFS